MAVRPQGPCAAPRRMVRARGLHPIEDILKRRPERVTSGSKTNRGADSIAPRALHRGYGSSIDPPTFVRAINPPAGGRTITPWYIRLAAILMDHRRRTTRPHSDVSVLFQSTRRCQCPVRTSTSGRCKKRAHEQGSALACFGIALRFAERSSSLHDSTCRHSHLVQTRRVGVTAWNRFRQSLK